MKRREVIQSIPVASLGIFPDVYPEATDLDTGLLWSFRGAGGTGGKEVSRFDEEIYFISDAVYAIDAKDGSVNWSYDTKATPVLETVAISESRVLLRTAEDVVVLDRTDGSEYWTVPDVSSSTADPDSLYVANDGTLTAFEWRRSKSLRWKTTHEGTIWKSPTVTADAVLVGTTSGTVQAFEIDDGAKRWTFTVPGEEYLRPVSSDRRLTNHHRPSNGEAVPLWNATKSILYGVRPEDGTRRWTYEFDTDLSWFPGVVTDSRIVVTDGTRLRVVDSATGETRWNYSSPDGTPFSAPVVADDKVLVNRGRTITSLSTSGTVDWETSLEDGSKCWLGGIGDEATCVYEPDGTVFVLSTRTGELRRKYELERRLATPPLVSNETVYVATENGALLGLDGTRKTFAEFVTRHDEAIGSGVVIATALAAVAARRLRKST